MLLIEVDNVAITHVIVRSVAVHRCLLSWVFSVCVLACISLHNATFRWCGQQAFLDSRFQHFVDDTIVQPAVAGNCSSSYPAASFGSDSLSANSWCKT